MKTNRTWLLLFVAIALIVILLFWRRSVQTSGIPTLATQVAVQSNSFLASNTNIAVQNILIAVSQTNSRSSKPDDHSRLPDIFQKYNDSHNIPIEFYGQVIDQDNNPVANVKIDVAIQQTYMKTPTELSVDSKIIPTEVESGTNGHFVIQGGEGDGFEIESIQKDGYKLSPQTRKTYVYVNVSAPFHPDPQNPVIIRMWKAGTSAQLISQDKDTRIPYDGTPVVFDLITGQKNTGSLATGDLRVTLTRNPLDIPIGYKNAFEWHATIEAISGGLIQSDDEFMYAAPEEGYQPRIQIDMPANANDWKNIYDIYFYAKTRNGNIYSRVKFEFRVDSSKPQTGFTITSAANPNGSRNLQP